MHIIQTYDAPSASATETCGASGIHSLQLSVYRQMLCHDLLDGKLAILLPSPIANLVGSQHTLYRLGFFLVEEKPKRRRSISSLDKN